MDEINYRAWSHRAADWSADYRDGVADRPVRAQVKPGDMASRLGDAAPELGGEMEAIFADFQSIIPDGMTHWQHPRFFAYFSSNAAKAALIGDQLANAFASQCMLWQTSPAATELEEKMVDWLRLALGLPQDFFGTFQDTASSATLCAVLTMRERALGFTGNKEGLSGKPKLRIYASSGTHSSVDKALWVAGLGQDNLVKIGPGSSGHAYEMDTEELQARISEDRAAGHIPAGIIAITGGTGIGAWDFLEPIAQIAKAEHLYTHLDAAWAGAAMICPEYRAQFWPGVEHFDSIVFNPHKWLGVQFDCSIQFLADAQPQRAVRHSAGDVERVRPRRRGAPADRQAARTAEVTGPDARFGRPAEVVEQHLGREACRVRATLRLADVGERRGRGGGRLDAQR